MNKKIVIFSLLAFLLGSCIKEDLSNCVLRFRFSYTYNKSGQNQLEQVRDIRVYIFDGSGLLFDVVRATQQDIAQGYMDHILPSGTYTAVAWGVSGTDKMQGGYKTVEMSNPVTSTYSPEVKIGTTTLNSFHTMIAYVPLPRETYGDITPQNDRFDDLFHAIAQNVSVVQGSNQTVDLDFMKNTSTLKVTITGLQHLEKRSSEQPLTVFAVGKNDRYSYNNQIDAYARLVRYRAPQWELSASEMTADIQMQRLIIDRHLSNDPVELYLQHPELGIDMIPAINIVDAILNARDASGNRLWQTQEDIDKEDEFFLGISILYDLSVKITINEFEVVDTDPNLRP